MVESHAVPGLSVPISELVPHAGAMSLLDRVLRVDDHSLEAEVTIRPGGLFGDECGGSAGVGAWVGVEYMAQAIAAWAGWHSRQRGEKPRIGFLLGTRRYDCERSVFLFGESLHIRVQSQFQADNGLGQFACQIMIDEIIVASAALTVFEPQDSAALQAATVTTPP